MTERTIDDQLREEYFGLLPEMTRTAEHLKTQIQYSLLPITRELKSHETVIVKSRVKECTSAIEALRRDIQGPSLIRTVLKFIPSGLYLI